VGDGRLGVTDAGRERLRWQMSWGERTGSCTNYK
jgi:hypothetical protein